MSVTTLHGSSVVVTGKIPNLTRTDVEVMLAEAGAHVQRSVSKTTDVLIIGADVGATKINAAKKWGTHVIPWSDAVALMNGAPAVESVAAPDPPSGKNQPVAPAKGYRQVFPMKCKDPDGETPEEKLPRSGEWIYEMKWDGYRAIAHVNGSTILASSNGNSYERYVHVVAELDAMTTDCILDGELASLDENGHSDLGRMQDGDIDGVKYMVFDVLEVRGTNVRGLPLRDRRKLLETILEGGGPYVLAAPIWDESERDDLLVYVQDNGLEGIVAKRLDSVYKEKARNGNWLKIKVRPGQEFVVVGYTAGKGNRAGTAGAFLLAVNDGTKTKPVWSYVGDVGSGGSVDDFERIRQLAEHWQGKKGPFDPVIDTKQFTRAQLKEITWVKPEVVLQVRFQKWTKDQKLWHPSIQGIRTDKSPKEVTRAA